MANILILVGTESGNAQMVADALKPVLEGAGHAVGVSDTAASAADLAGRDVLLVVCATHGSGDIPTNILPLAETLERDRPDLSHREVFLRVRAPAGVLKPTAVTEAFQAWTRRGRLPIPYQGPHCLRHSLAVHLLRRGTSVKAIGDLLGHRSAEATCVYLRLAVDDLRDAALEVPSEVRS